MVYKHACFFLNQKSTAKEGHRNSKKEEPNVSNVRRIHVIDLKSLSFKTPNNLHLPFRFTNLHSNGTSTELNETPLSRCVASSKGTSKPDCVFTCLKCRIEFYEERHFKEHRKEHVMTMCPKCDLRIEKILLPQHSCLGQKCRVCSVVFENSTELEQHLAAYHAECEVCRQIHYDGECKSRISSNSERGNQLPAKKFKCGNCTFAGFNMQQLCSHINLVHPDDNRVLPTKSTMDQNAPTDYIEVHMIIN